MRIFLLIIFLLISALTAAVPVLAQDYRGEAMTQLGAAVGEKGAGFGPASDPRAVAAYTVQIIMGTMGIIFLGLMVYAGYLMLTSAGEEEKMLKGRKIIWQAVLGILISLSAFSIALFTEKYLREATDAGEPGPGFYAGVNYEMDKDLPAFNSDPLQQPSDMGLTIWPDSGQAQTW